MGNKKEPVTESERLAIIEYYTDCENYRQTARHFNRSDGTIRNIIKKERIRTDGGIMRKITQVKKEKAKSVLDMLAKDDRFTKVIDIILDLATNEDNLKREFEKRGLAPLNATMGTILDKALKYKQLNDDIKPVNDVLTEDDGFDTAREKFYNSDNIKSVIEPDSLEETDV